LTPLSVLIDSDLEAALYTNIGSKQGYRRHVEPDWALIHRELKRKHVTLSILWDEYIEQHPEGFGTRASVSSMAAGHASCR
jgi:transposase